MGSSSPGHVTLTPVYWAPTGYSFPASYKSIINTYLADVAAASGTTGNVFAVATEYYQKLGASPDQYIQYSVDAGAEVDVSAAYPAQDATTGCTVSSGSGNTACVADGAIQTQLQSTLHADSLPVDDAHLYLVFFPPNVETCQLNGAGDSTPCSANSYCGYHGAFQDASANNAPAIYADMPYGDPSGCGDPYNGTQAPSGNSYADTEISVTSHEASESITDWGNAWRDANGYENGDECGYTYGTPLGSTGVTTDGAATGTMYNQVINGHRYYTQDEFSNVAYAANVGDVNTPTSPHYPGFANIKVAGCLQHGFAISTSTLPPATPGVAYGPVTLQAANVGVSSPPYATTLKWKKIILPKGLKLSSAGVLSGTPNKKLVPGASSVTVQVTETVTTLNGTKKVRGKIPVQATITLYLIGPGANLAGAQLAGADLSSADLAGTILVGADLDGANLSGSQATSAVFVGANLINANLTGANLTGASFLAANLTGATFTGATLSGVLWLNAICPDGAQASLLDPTCIGQGI